VLGSTYCFLGCLLIYQVSGLQGKTPISYLQEMCNKRGITPQYDLIANEGAVHEPLFVFKVTAGEYIGTGKGLVFKWTVNSSSADECEFSQFSFPKSCYT